MSRNTWYKRYPRDLISATVGMSLEEKAAYSLIIDLVHMHDGAVADDARYISGVLGCTQGKWMSIRSCLRTANLITVSDGSILLVEADQ